MSYSSLTNDRPAGQRAFYGEPQHETVQVDDRDIFCAGEPREEERNLYTGSEHYRLSDPDFVSSTVDGQSARVA
ncbi:hypothetical protein ACH9L7_13195 [Haloferax sp. S1W]|uniref:hypothetical protein n=1 Tax=Haloferax sp. S1W TaxID=3377110 RepID=UPI0037C785E5